MHILDFQWILCACTFKPFCIFLLYLCNSMHTETFSWFWLKKIRSRLNHRFAVWSHKINTRISISPTLSSVSLKIYIEFTLWFFAHISSLDFPRKIQFLLKFRAKKNRTKNTNSKITHFLPRIFFLPVFKVLVLFHSMVEQSCFLLSGLLSPVLNAISNTWSQMLAYIQNSHRFDLILISKHIHLIYLWLNISQRC